MKKSAVLLLLASQATLACELKESKEIYGYDYANCKINNISYLINTQSFGQNIDIKKTPKVIILSSTTGSSTIVSLYIDTSDVKPIASVVETKNIYPNDFDNRIKICRAKANITLQQSKEFDPKPYFDYLETNMQTKKICSSEYTPKFSIKELSDLLTGKTGNFNPIDGLEGISDPNRYLSYLKKYPITSKNETLYTKITQQLYGYRLYNEAIFLSVNIINKNPKNLLAKLTLADSYYSGGDKTKAKKYYKEFAKAAKAADVNIPKRVLNRI